MELYNDDCFNIFPNIEDKSINLFLLDLPYANKTFGNCTACKWDSPIDLVRMWIEIKRMMKPNGIIVFYCNTKFGFTLIESNPSWFKYDLIWKKSRKVGFLSANKQPLRQHENIYIFNDKPVTHSKNEDEEYSTYNPQKTEGKPFKVKGGKSKSVDGSLSRGHEVISKEYENKGDRHPTSIIEHENLYVFDSCSNDDVDITRNIELRDYAKKVYKFIGKTKKEIIKKMGLKIDHFFRFKSSQFGLCVNETYDELIKHYKINEMEGFLDYDILKSLEELSTYNPQKTEGKPYKSKERIETEGVYIKDSYKRTATKDTTNRHPTSIIEHENLYVFKKEQGIYNPQKTEGKPYNKTNTGNNNKDECSYGKINRSSHLEGDGNRAINKGDRHPTSIIEHENLYVFKKEQGTYNPQKTEGKPYKIKEGGEINNNIYGNFKRMGDNKGDRHPTSIIDQEIENTILEYNNPAKSLHRTQKPVELCEWLIKTYTNEDDVVMDFTMGSGTVGIACSNTNRDFIGIEMDKEIFKIAENRILKHVSSN